MNETAVTFANISKHFVARNGQSQTVLDRVSFTIPAGKTTVIAGGSGQGKSVLLKLIVGLLKADAGSILVDDIEGVVMDRHNHLGFDEFHGLGRIQHASASEADDQIDPDVLDPRREVEVWAAGGVVHLSNRTGSNEFNFTSGELRNCGIFNGDLWARILGIIGASLNVLAQMAFLSIYPAWSFLIILIDALVIYALAVHGDEVAEL